MTDCKAQGIWEAVIKKCSADGTSGVSSNAPHFGGGAGCQTLPKITAALPTQVTSLAAGAGCTRASSQQQLSKPPVLFVCVCQGRFVALTLTSAAWIPWPPSTRPKRCQCWTRYGSRDFTDVRNPWRCSCPLSGQWTAAVPQGAGATEGRLAATPAGAVLGATVRISRLLLSGSRISGYGRPAPPPPAAVAPAGGPHSVGSLTGLAGAIASVTGQFGAPVPAAAAAPTYVTSTGQIVTAASLQQGVQPLQLAPGALPWCSQNSSRRYRSTAVDHLHQRSGGRGLFLGLLQRQRLQLCWVEQDIQHQSALPLQHPPRLLLYCLVCSLIGLSAGSSTGSSKASWACESQSFMGCHRLLFMCTLRRP